MVATTWELRHSTQNFVRLSGDYLVTEGPLSRSMATWPRCIDRFKSQYDKVFTGHSLFGVDIVDQTHKQLEVLLRSCNTTSLEDVEIGSLAEFG